MSTELGELYRKVVLEHNRNPKNFGALPSYTHHALGHNPLCGDRIELFLRLENQQIQQVGFVGEGCAICVASASLLTEAMQHKTPEQMAALMRAFTQLVSGGTLDSQDTQRLGPLQVFSGVSAYPTRMKCATLAWRTLQAALAQSEKTVSTE